MAAPSTAIRLQFHQQQQPSHNTNINPSTMINLNQQSSNSPQHRSQLHLRERLLRDQTSIANDKVMPNRVNLQAQNTNDLSSVMSKLHKKSDSMKSWSEITKSMKQCLIEKRPIATDNNERFHLQKCLDTIQKTIEVKSVQSMVERLETICRQLKLKFNCQKNYECFVHSEMYYVEIKLNRDNGKALDCKIAHHTHDVLSCPELIDALSRGDFIEFTKHLEGLSAIYKIDTDKKIKEKAYLALHALEKDLEQLAKLQNNQINDINNLVHRSPVGVLEPRKGGYPMKLTFFVPPYDLIDLSTKTIFPLTVDTIMDRKLGYSATVCIEKSSTFHRLQTDFLISIKTSEGKNLPQFNAHTAANTSQLPACFVLRLTKPLPICADVTHKISKLTGIDLPNCASQNSSSLISLLAEVILSNSDFGIETSFSSSNSFNAILPDQNHCYYVNENDDSMKAFLINKIPFTHPTHVPRILVLLRQQVLFNVILGSIIRQFGQKIKNMNVHIFEISYSSLQNIYVQFEHPNEQSLATMDIDLKDLSQVKCKLHANFLNNVCSEDYVNKVMQRSFSIPVTMRAIINKSKESDKKLKDSFKNEPITNSASSIFYQTIKNENNSIEQTSNSNNINILKNEVFNANNNSQISSCNDQTKNQKSNLKFNSLNKQITQLKLPAGTNWAHQQHPVNQVKSTNSTFQTNSTMLMSMLSDVPAQGLQQQSKLNKKRKRLSTSEISECIPKKTTIERENIKREPDYANASISSVTLSTSNSMENENFQPLYTIKSEDDGHNEQLKIIKSLEELNNQKESFSGGDIPKFIFKNEKGNNSFKVNKVKANQFTSVNKKTGNSNNDVEYIETVKKERKRKRTDSLEGKDLATGSPEISLLNQSGGASGLNLSQLMITQYYNHQPNNTNQPKIKRSTSLVTSSSTSLTSPTQLNYQNKNLQLGNSIAMKYSDNIKLLSMMNKQASPSNAVNSAALSITASNNNSCKQTIAQQQSNNNNSQISMLTTSKMSDLEQAAAMAVAASSGGMSAAMAHAVAVAAVNSYSDSSAKRAGKPIKLKNTTALPTSLTNAQNALNAIGTSGASKSPITITVSSSSSGAVSSATATTPNNLSVSSATALVANRLKEMTKLQANSILSNSLTKQQKSLSANVNASSLTISPSATSPKVLHQQSALVQSATSSAALANAKNTLSKPRKPSLNSVVDRLLNSQSLSSVSSPEINSVTPNRVDGSTPSKLLNRSTSEVKGKYFRDSQFTIKQSTSGLKMSITKTKPHGTNTQATNSNTVAELMSKIGLYKTTTNTKYTIPKIPKTNQQSSSTSSTTVSSTSAAITSPTISSNTIVVSSTSPTMNKRSSPPSGGKVSPASSSVNQNRVGFKNTNNAKISLFKSPDPPQSYSVGSKTSPQPANNRSIPSNTFKISNSYQQNIGWSHERANSVLLSSNDLFSPNSDSTINQRSNVQKVSSSSDNNSQKGLSTSTPSSPVECSPFMEKNSPLIIPIEAVSDEKPSPNTVNESSNDFNSTMSKSNESVEFSQVCSSSSIESKSEFTVSSNNGSIQSSLLTTESPVSIIEESSSTSVIE